MSLQYRLPLLIMVLLLVLVAGGAGMAYREVRASAVDARVERLARVSSQLAALVDSSAGLQLAEMREASGSAAVLAYLLGSAPEADAAEALRAQLDLEGDSLPTELWTAERDVALRIGALPSWLTPAQADSLHAARGVRAAGGYSELLRVGDRTFVWLATPVERSETVVGYIAQLRAVGSNGGGSAQVSQLLGGGGTVYFENEGGGWFTLGGAPVGQPEAAAEGEPYARADARFIMQRTPVGAGPLSVVVEASMDEVLAGPTAFLRRLFAGAALLLLLGALGAWLLSRRIVSPLLELNRAASDVAAGDYGRRVDVDRTDEIGTLARAFSTMAAEVERARDALRGKLDEARRLAATVEATNRQLTDAMAAAEHARSDAESANRAKSEFLATMSHEIRTPINAIIGYTDLLQLEIPGELTPAQRAHLQRIRASGGHLMRLVDEVLDLSRIESGRLQVQDRVGTAGEAIAAAYAVVAPDAERKRITIVAPPDGDADVCYHGDPHRVRQVLINLLTNAVKFTPDGGRVDIRTSACQNGDDQRAWACIAVHDTGVGIADDQLDSVFEPFVQGDRGYTRAHGGVGLGLSISRRLARMMEGDVDVTSAPGQGSTFTLRLPLARATESAG